MHIPTIRRALSLALLAPLLMSCGPALGEPIYTAVQEDLTAFSVSHHQPPTGRRWVMCGDGRNEGRMAAISSAGGAITLTNGHVLTVHRGAVSDSTDFVFVEPRSPQVLVHASAPGRFASPGVKLTLSWENRPGCSVPRDAVIARIRPGQPALEIRSAPVSGANAIETVDPLLELSGYALAR